MESYDLILEKLEAFTTRYYRRRLLKGVFLFLFIGGLILLAIGGLEYFLWLNSRSRSLLLWAGVLLEGFLFLRYILAPLSQLFRLRKGLSYKEGSRLIGTHFPEVSDKLFNLLELSENTERSELLLASIEQRSRELARVPFHRAVKMNEAYQFSKYAVIPLIAGVGIWLTGNGLGFLKSYQRVVNYEMAYEAPAPFSFELLTPSLVAREDQVFQLRVRTPGTVQPDQVQLVLEGSTIIMERKEGFFEYNFRPPLKSTEFYFEASEVSSRPYTLEVLPVPVIDRFEMRFAYPKYLDLTDKIVQATGNATVPEGTWVEWRFRTVHADNVVYTDPDTVLVKPVSDNETGFGRRVFNPLLYTVSASNEGIPEHDKLEYKIDVVRDEPPGIKVEMVQDTTNVNVAFFEGTVSDDHGLQGLRMFAFPSNAEEERQEIEIPVPKAAFHTFYYTFPSGLEIQEKGAYTVVFEVKDNDGNKGGKTRRSREFRLRLFDEEEVEDLDLDRQNDVLNGMERSAGDRKDLEKTLEELLQDQKESGELSFDEKEKLKRFFEKQEQQERLMEKFSKELSENLEERSEPESELLKERLERQEAEARKNAAMMEEMREILDKLDKEELEARMEELSKSQKNNRRSMEQLLELTKRYYVQEKSRQLARKLSRLAEAQSREAESREARENREKEQQGLNEEFSSVKEALKELEQSNKNLQKPLPWERDQKTEQAATQNQEEALEELKKENNQPAEDEGSSPSDMDARKQQKRASEKLKELSEGLEQGASGGGAETIAEDAEMLRQILDNLVVFSVEEEMLFNRIQEGGSDPVGRSGEIRKQQQLRQLFEHVDDSLFALSLRRAEISEIVNTKITDVYYNVDKALESFSENNWFRGASYQQYVFTAANELSAFLADMLDNMQDSLMPGKGEGQGSDVQLPDIIQSQEELRKKMQEGGEKEGSEGKPDATGSSQEQGSGEEGGSGEASGNSGGKKGEGKGQGEGQGGENGEGDSQKGSGDSGSEKGQGKDMGDGKGQDGGEGGLSEAEYEEYYQIYKEQQRIRQELEFQLEIMINDADRSLGERIAREMEMFENELLQNGITQKTADRLNRIQQQLMQLENAALKQGLEDKREGITRKKEFTSPVLTPPEIFGRKKREIEFLNREALPLRRQYRDRVKKYFIGRDSVPLSDRIQPEE